MQASVHGVVSEAFQRMPEDLLTEELLRKLFFPIPGTR